ncbi:hypothetical protein FQ154_18805 [Paeniglutamicibacter gangotriensis]|uniref:Uncharacterized protein n=1 Tax=Paeniglutamicibacter gangotriensis TaxID=254787 RepID=A0A5B0E611_9MICC|nr:hypothetical protein [Paeniglutamicibacter gangotriensis]KAA0973351.1 hypothetical protein FQ154_18805 [Paeniglutamicibacter gangotriensis]
MESTFFAIFGIVVTLLGACCTFIAAVQRPAPITEPGSDVPVKEMLDSRHQARISGWEKYSEERRNEEFKKSEELRAQHDKQLTERIREAWEKDRSVMVKRNAAGLSLIAVGSVLQGVAILFS